MNYSTAVMLFNEEIRAIRVCYDPNEEPNKKKNIPGRTYLLKTLDQTVQEGDYVVIPTDTRYNMTVVKVMEVDCEVDFDSSIELKWIISKVDVETAEQILEDEKKWIDALKASEKRKKKQQIRENMMDMMNGDKDDIAKMALTFTGSREEVKDEQTPTDDAEGSV